MNKEMNKIMNTLTKEMTKENRLNIDFSNAGDIAFFTGLLKTAISGMSGISKKGKKEITDKIPKAQNSYMEFCKDARQTADFSNIKDPKEKSRLLGKMWNELSEEEKAVYKKRADKNKEKYIEACRALEKSKADLANVSVNVSENVEKEKKKEKKTEKKEKAEKKEKKKVKEVEMEMPPLEDVPEVSPVVIVEKPVEAEKPKKAKKDKK